MLGTSDLALDVGFEFFDVIRTEGINLALDA